MIYCNKIHCKYNRANDVKSGKRICVYSGDLELNDQCQCEKFERSITWYFNNGRYIYSRRIFERGLK